MRHWAWLIGPAITATGILLLVIRRQQLAARWSDVETLKQERRLQLRVCIGIGLVLIGIGLQIYRASKPTPYGECSQSRQGKGAECSSHEKQFPGTQPLSSFNHNE